ncbi:MAG: glutathione S-transferase [Dokdonella sp.]
MALPILYSFRRCPYAMRARMAVQVSGQAVELREVRLREKPAHLLAASPKGTVPVLIDAKGRVIDESLDIMLWALQKNDPERWLANSSATEIEMSELIARCDDEFKPRLDRYKYPQRFAEFDRLTERQRGLQFLQSLEHQLEHGPWLFGDRGSLADFAILPFVRQFEMVDPEWFVTCPLPRVRDWLARWIASPLFERIMIRVEPWSPDQPCVIFPAAATLR